jgi:hypothetical protein
LHSKIARLRRLLGESVIETVGEGYRLRAEVTQLDLLWFDSLVSQATAAADDGQAAAALTEAISLWHGDPLVNTDSLTLASEAAPQLTERYLLACERWAEVSLRLGRPAEVVQRIIPLADAHPFREPIVRLLMLAFYQDGRQAEALTIYDGLRRRLSEELGADPSPALRDMHTAILRGELMQSGPALVESRQPDPEPATINLGDRPLVLVPMLSGVRALICNLERPDAVWIAYPTPRIGTAASQKTGWPVRSDLLGSVMGPARAEILLALERPLTTARLGKLSRLVPSVLAHHCERLAAAGLVQHEKLGDQTWISRTSRGTGMVALFAEQP